MEDYVLLAVVYFLLTLNIYLMKKFNWKNLLVELVRVAIAAVSGWLAGV